MGMYAGSGAFPFLFVLARRVPVALPRLRLSCHAFLRRMGRDIFIMTFGYYYYGMRKLVVLLFVMCVLPAHAQHKSYHGDGIDDYLRFVPIASVYALKASGVEGASSWKRLLVNTATSCAITVGVTWGLKAAIKDNRPDGTGDDAFPSGHTSFAFAGATILHKEYGKVSPWISVAGYGVAAVTAVDRVRRHRHEWDDVLAGAAIGILATEAGYFLGDLITGEQSRYSVGVGAEGVMVCIRL